MTVRPAQLEPNPLSRLVDGVPTNGALAVSIATKLLGAALALWYAYDQDTLFPSEHFPRTWAFVAFIGVIAQFKSVIIWCKAFPTVFAYATLEAQ